MECKCDARTKLVGDGCEACNPRLALDVALGAYWDAAYDEGCECRIYDTEAGAADKALRAVQSAVAALLAAERERCAKLRTAAAQVLTDMRAQGVLLEWQTLMEEALRA